MPKKTEELERERQKEINRLYSAVRQEYPQALAADVLRMINEHPAPRFYVTTTTAYTWIWCVETVGNDRLYRINQQVADFYRLFQEAWLRNPERSVLSLVKEIINNQAPSIYAIQTDLQKW